MANDTNSTSGYAPFDLYAYNPAQVPAYAYLGLFGAVGIAHFIAMIPYRAFFAIPLIIGCGMEAAAYYFRSRSHNDVRKTLPFLLQNLLILASPPFLAASLYMSPRRIGRAINCEDQVASPRLLTKIFVVVDLTCFATQVAGAILSGSDDVGQARQGRTVILVGLVIQIIAFGFFALWTGVFHTRARKSDSVREKMKGIKWQRPLFGLYAIGLLFVIRNITRIIEYKQGPGGEMQSSEVYLYVLDASVMLAIVVIFLVLHPGRLRMKARRLRRQGSSDDHIPLK
ncbi:hypothetical protein VTK73DRAFT_2412 [Phialemonium thermophilum]|uniref:RTA1 like protein n=1 Tax=Phialemonium thermophilum TaxID=223376 RepID=A0ABR3X4N5_9PEZI